MAYYRQWIQGEQVSYSDLLDLQDRTRYLATLGAGSILRTPNWCQYNPASITLSVDSTGKNVLFGGPSTNFFIDYRYCDYVPQQSFPVSSNAGGSGQRNDIIAAIPVDVQGSAFQRGVKIGNTVTVTTCYTQYDGIETEYVVGTPGEGDPAVPGGYVPLVRIAVPAGASTVSESDLIILLPTAADIIASEIAGGVTSINDLMGAIQLVSRTPQYLAVDANNGQIGLSVELPTIVDSINNLTGAVEIVAGENVNVSQSGQEISVSAPTQLFGATITAIATFAAYGPASAELTIPGNGSIWLIEAYAVNFDFASDSTQSASLTGTFEASPNGSNYSQWYGGGSATGTSSTVTSTSTRTIYDRQCVIHGQAFSGDVIKASFSTNGPLRAGIGAGTVLIRATYLEGD